MMNEAHDAGSNEDGERSYAGYAPPLDTPEQRRRAVEIAFDFRGDVTIETRDGRTIEGFVYDRKIKGEQLAVRIMPRDGSPRVTLPAEQISRLVCDQRDPAAGRSFETWVKKYVEKKLRGEAANIEANIEDEGGRNAEA